MAVCLGAPAQAYSSDYSTWSPVPTMRQGSSGDLVGLWQAILYSDGFAIKCVSQDSQRGIAGAFGAYTTAASKAWQYDRGLSNDGVVGPQAWSKAFSRTHAIPVWDDLPSAGFRLHDGTWGAVFIHRQMPDDILWWDPKWEWHYQNPANPGQGMVPRFVTGVTSLYTC